MSSFDGGVSEWGNGKLREECAKLGATVGEIKEEAEELGWTSEYLIVHYKKERRLTRKFDETDSL